MKKSNIYFLTFFIVIILYLLTSNLFLINIFKNNYNLIINPFFWGIMFVVAKILGMGYARYKNKTDKIKKIIIILLFYIILYYSSGLILGFERSPYSHSFTGIILNLWQFIIVIIFQEYVRAFLLTNSKGKIKTVLITILLVLININFSSLISNIKNINSAFEYISSTILPIVFTNITCTYLCKIGSSKMVLWYRLPLEIIYIISPIFPAYNWLIRGFVGIILPIIIFMFISYDYEKEQQILTRQRQKKENPFLLIPFIFISITLICFVAGVFKYEPMAILSNSMSPTYNRGDVVIFTKLNEKELENIELYTIIVYRLDNILVAHRIVEIEKNLKGETVYITKGDNNIARDNREVEKSQIVGAVKATIPYVGYPSVWLNDIFNKQEVSVET